MSWTLHMGRFVEMAFGVVVVGGGIWAVGTMGIQDQAQSIINGQGETELDNDQN